jgi:hypothetical protein
MWSAIATELRLPAAGRRGMLMCTATAETTYLDRLLAPVVQSFTRETAERLIGLPADPQIAAHIEELAAKANEGGLSAEERAEYEDYVEAVDLIAILQSQARKTLAKDSAS